MKIGREQEDERNADFGACAGMTRGSRLPRALATPGNTHLQPPAYRGAHCKVPANPHSALCGNRHSGFTLVELLVAMALFAVLMSGVLLLFVGSVRSAKTSYQQIDAFEKARSTLTVVQNDLVSSFTSHQSADVHSFYATPIGMTFIGMIPSSTGSGNFGVARITYVVYNRVINKGTLIDDVNTDAYQYRFPEALEDRTPKWNPITGEQIYITDGDGVQQPQYDINHLDAYPYALLRYVEPGVSDLNMFPIPWVDKLGNPTQYAIVLDNLLTNRGCTFGVETKQPPLSDEQREQLWSTTCEMWIRMLAGGDIDVPVNYWTDTNLHADPSTGNAVTVNPLDYMVADNVLSAYPPNRATASQNPPGLRYDGQSLNIEPNGNRQDRPFCAKAFFDYDMASSFVNNVDKNGNKLANVWWNDTRSNAVHARNQDGTPYGWDCISGAVDFNAATWDMRLPETVTMSFWLMFESPYPGAPDFQRYFSLQINIPAAYERPTE